MLLDKQTGGLPPELKFQIFRHLDISDLLNASASCKFWYLALCDEVIWEAAYAKLTRGYPIHQFVVTDCVRSVTRPKFVQLDGSEDLSAQWLDDWTQSWKQRSVFAVHVLNIQREVTSAAQQKTMMFDPPKSTPLYSAAFIQNIETALGAPFPIDFVLYLLYFSPYLTFSAFDSHPPCALASGPIFQQEPWWKSTNAIIQFSTVYPSSKRLEDLSQAAIEFMYSTRMACFGLADWTFGFPTKEFLTLLLDANWNLQGQLPGVISRHGLRVDFQGMKSGIGKVFRQTQENKTYELCCIAESFTDYLIQYVATAITTGYLPSWTLMGYNDLMSTLPRLDGLPVSILIPQAQDWSIAHYLPTYYSQEMICRFPSYEAHVYYDSYADHLSWLTAEALDNPDHVHLPDPPVHIANGFYTRRWQPYLQFVVSQNGIDVPNSLLELEELSVSQPASQHINQDIYRLERQLIDDWIQTSPNTVKTCKYKSDTELQEIQRKTDRLQSEVFQLFTQRLPFILYYSQHIDGLCYLHTYKHFLDHLECLKSRKFKYNALDLDFVEDRFRYLLNWMRGVYLNHRYYIDWQPGINDASESTLDWSEVAVRANSLVR
ncbi:hypothetical protein K450DRAFT_246549 [Umbelopsis ramanniana AG]|uniref:F-box domain-containing protein n=1 Tax=Umbelopsis ramanniana AG TaxID=1314678 RepID=A0AAD5HDW8_UMBRA|nr:uncharacterized protein K450DRAFT_246549 [Umbelopsis ramanniana AG]KAI8578583.1 hypothetical protein K450DRAFT_246549 [Umbelopsis ramanniana AG]